MPSPFPDQETGIQVIRTYIKNTSTNLPAKYGDDDSLKTPVSNVILAGNRFLEPLLGKNKQDIIDELGRQVAQVYYVYFEVTDPVQIGDKVLFNESTIYSQVPYLPASDDQELTIHSYIIGGSDIGMKTATCITNN